MPETPSILFVCLGNICRSPMAEGALRARLADAGLDWHVDSAGTGAWHVGNPPDPRAQQISAEKGVDISGLRARQARADDFTRFTHVFALDTANLADLKALRPVGAPAHLSLLLDEVEGLEGQPVADPYYGGDEGFYRTWDQVDRAARALVARLG